MSAALDAIAGLVKEMARAVVDEAAPTLVEKLAPTVIREVMKVLNEERRKEGNAIYVTVRLAAQMMSAHPSTVRKLLNDGKLGRFSVEGQLRVKVSDVHAYMAREGGVSPAIDINERALAILGQTRAKNDT